MRLIPTTPNESSRTVILGGMIINRDFIPEGTMVLTAASTDGPNEQRFSDINLYHQKR